PRTARQSGSPIDFKVVGAIVGGFFGVAGILVLATWGYNASGLAGPNPETIKAAIATNYEIQGNGWNGDGRTNGVGVFNVGTHAFGISVDGTVHICLANLEQVHAKQPITCNDHFVVTPKP
ncbi:hypothetical protein NOH08_23280, partial [Escherichia coli]|uniref:hypothetical protein n=1 Tax=Escherichia coli TaxID=562 RepID=UPI002105416E